LRGVLVEELVPVRDAILEWKLDAKLEDSVSGRLVAILLQSVDRIIWLGNIAYGCCSSGSSCSRSCAVRSGLLVFLEVPATYH